MVDIYEIAPQENTKRTSTPFAYTGQGARVARYQHLISKIDSQANDHGGSEPKVQVDWLVDEDTMEMQEHRPASIKTVESDDGPLVGTFADAAAAMT